MTATREAVLQYALDAWGDEPDYPFPGDDVSAVLRHPDNRKWYALLMAVSAHSLHMPGESACPILNIKLDPLLIGSLLHRPGFLPAYHMNKTQWITILLDGSLTIDDVAPLLDMSWNATRGRRRGKDF